MALTMTKAGLASFLAQQFPQVAQDFVLDSVGDDEMVVRLKVGQRHLRPGGTVSGPNIFALADVAIYLAILARIGPVALAVTTNASIDFMRKPAAGADLIARARILKLGRTLAVGDVLVYSDGVPEPVARSSMTYAIPGSPD